MVLTTYGRSSGFCVDPIEKKPLNHFYPGTSILSFGTAGCNLACKFCQNWDISKSREMDRLQDQASPQAIAAAALEPRLQVGRLHLQRPGDLRRVRDGHRRRLPRPGRADRGGDRRLHPRRAAARVLREDGRGQRRPEGASPTSSTSRSAAAGCSRCSTRWCTWCRRPGSGSRSPRCSFPGKNDSDEELHAECKWIMREPRARRAAAFHRLPSRLQDDRHRRARRPRR